jgi:protein-L-isoaspartate O-methyltransferase
MLDLATVRDRMVDVQIARRGVRDRYVLEALRRVPREAFLEPGFEELPMRMALSRSGRVKRSHSPTSSR